MLLSELAGSEHSRLLALIKSGLASLPVASGLSHGCTALTLAGSENSRLPASIGSGLGSLPVMRGFL